MRIGSSMDNGQLVIQMRLGKGNNQDGQMKSIQNQITNVQENLQKLSENEDLSLEQKLEKKKELEQQLQDLNQQLMQRQLEIQKENREKQTQEAKEQLPREKAVENDFPNVVDASTMQGMIRANDDMSQIKKTYAVKSGMEGRSRVVASEIKLDKGRGKSTRLKEEELAGLQENIGNTANDIGKRISSIKHTLEESGDTDVKDRKSTDEKIKDEGEMTESETENPKNDLLSRYNPINILL